MPFDSTRRAWLLATVLLPAGLALVGCATNRSELRIDAPKGIAAKPGAPVIVIRNITDARVFKDDPEGPHVPSLGGDGASKAPAGVKARAVGRKSNTYGHALGDVLLDDGQTVGGVVRENLTAAFNEAGYAVQPTATAGAVTVDVNIRQLWAWAKPGFTEITMNMHMDVDLTFSGKGGRRTVTVRATEGRLAAGEDAWREILLKGFAEFRTQTASTLKSLPR